MATTRLVLIRHAHTPSNGDRGSLLSGRTDVPLSRRGQEELHHLRRRLPNIVPFDVIYSSPLLRARETTAVLEQAGLGPVRVCPGLQEIDCGALDGMHLGEVRSRYPDLWEINQRQVDDDFRWPGGESYREFRYRCLTALRRLARQHPGGRIAAVTHAGVISQLVGFLAGTRPAQWERYRPGNTALTEMEWERGRGRLVCFDDRSHLPAVEETPAGSR